MTVTAAPWASDRRSTNPRVESLSTKTSLESSAAPWGRTMQITSALPP
ncbi:MAG: hypothetical protein ACKON7_02120 [Planctomycetaceae bacterium]